GGPRRRSAPSTRGRGRGRARRRICARRALRVLSASRHSADPTSRHTVNRPYPKEPGTAVGCRCGRLGPAADEEESAMAELAVVGVTGLAVMGRNLARNLARNGFTVAVHNRTSARTTALVEQFGDEGRFVPSESVEEFVASLERPRKVLVMVKAGAPTDAVIDELVPLLDPGDIVIDGGNAWFEDTRRRERELRERGLHFVGAGVSGGDAGALHGPR